MASLQTEIEDSLHRRMISRYEGCFEAPKQVLTNLDKSSSFFDPKREVIINLDYIEESDENLKFVNNIRIQKLNAKTGEFEFTRYRIRVLFDESSYNYEEGHLLLYQKNKKKLFIYFISNNNESLIKAQELDLDVFRSLEYNYGLKGFIAKGEAKLNSDKFNLLTINAKGQYEVSSITTKVGFSQYGYIEIPEIFFDRKNKTFLVFNAAGEIEIFAINDESRLYSQISSVSFFLKNENNMPLLNILKDSFTNLIVDRNGSLIVKDSEWVNILNLNYSTKLLEVVDRKSFHGQTK